MSLHRWLRKLRSALAPGRGQRQHQGRGSLRAASHRPSLEVLEDRLTPSFSPATSFPVGPNPQAVVTADFNNDGRLDLATANAGGNTVSVSLGDGRGGFGAANHFAVGGGSPHSLAAADFNKDGNLDLTTDTQGRVAVLLGNGDGTFRAPTNPYMTGYVLSVAVGDFNSDSNTDVVVSEDDGEGFGVFQVALGNGRGGFSLVPYTTQLDYDARGLAVADVNGDGNLDAVTADVFVLLGNGDGTLRENSYWYNTGLSDPDPRAVAVGNFTGDGIPDLVVAGQTVVVLPGLGDGMFASAIHHTANGSMHTGVAVADFNGDGKPDAVMADTDTGTVSELRGNGNGTLTYAGATAVGSSPTAVAVGDFNGDGRPDAATANGGSNTVSVLLNNGTWPPPPPSLRIGDVTVTEGNTGTAAATFTVTLSAASTQTVTVAYSTGNGTATAGSDYQARSGIVSIPAGKTTGTITAPVLGDRLPEPNETFFVNLSGASNATIADGQALGTIVDDEPRISITDVTKAEGKKGKTTPFTYTVTLSAAYDQPVTVSFQTADGTATTGDNDYIGKSGTLTFAPGETTKTITIDVKGDSKREADETFYLDLFGNSGNALLTKKRGLGTILNDD
jgi:hypothetical protein